MAQHAINSEERTAPHGYVPVEPDIRSRNILAAFRTAAGIVFQLSMGVGNGAGLFFNPRHQSGECYQLGGYDQANCYGTRYVFSATACDIKAGLLISGRWDLGKVRRVALDMEPIGDKEVEALQEKIRGEWNLLALPKERRIEYALHAAIMSEGQRCHLAITRRQYGGVPEHCAYIIPHDFSDGIIEIGVDRSRWGWEGDLSGVDEHIPLATGQTVNIRRSYDGLNIYGVNIDGERAELLNPHHAERLAGRLKDVPAAWTPLITPAGDLCEHKCSPARVLRCNYLRATCFCY
ncbi:MAG: hypothetical protein PHY92_09185 [Alphaproteobacteria bacterium]|nr:hypothetical protein [Alphaproteobacteria bacterium]